MSLTELLTDSRETGIWKGVTSQDLPDVKDGILVVDHPRNPLI